MPSHRKDAAKVRFPPPVIFLLAVSFGYLLNRVVWLWSTGSGSANRAVIAAVFFTAGMSLLLAGLLHFRRTKQSPEPWTATPEVISEGIYRYSRNPMYLGMALIQFAVGIYLDNVWILILLPCSMMLVTWIAIIPEEDYLQTKFGDIYRQYKSKVRRWL